MEAQKHPGLTVALADQTLPTSSLQPAQGPSTLSQSSVIPPQEPALSQPVYLKALTIPLYQPVQPGCFQPSSQLVTGRSCGNLDSSSIPLILNPLVPSEGTDQPQSVFQKQLGQTLTLNIVSTLPVLSSPNSSVNATIGSPGKSKNAGKYICKHCGRDCLKPSVLEKHIRSHTGERPFPCTTCGIAFKTQSNLYKHRRTQTHVNNTKLPSDSDNTGIPEQNEKATESITSQQGTKGHGSSYEDRGIQMKQVTLETGVVTDSKKLNDLSVPATSNSLMVSENQERTHQSFSSKTDRGVPEKEPPSLSSPVALPNDQCQIKKMQEQRTPAANKHVQLQRQHATSSEKQWDYKPFDCKLKKCESTDSGYLSRSDSTEQQMASSSPLHSLCEHNAELENETGFGSSRCTAGSSAKSEPAEKATALMLEKKRLEEHISKLISHNKIVVDDTQLDNVRPRKTVLSKQGSIDLPMPYTYKDSFHFDIRAFDANRKKNLSLCSAKSTLAPLEKCKPMFFHSVPTQFSTTIDAVPVTRSNSLPFVEGTRTVHDNAGCSKLLSLTKQSANTGAASLLPSNNLVANSVDFPSSHPRALVRQTAVDDLPLSNVADHPPPSEELQMGAKLGAGEIVSTKNKKHSQRKLKMFSQEKWQMYGDETFKKIYQKMKSSQNSRKIKQRGNKIPDIAGSTPDSKESVSSTDIAEEKDARSSASDSLSSHVSTELNTVKSETGANGNHIPHNASSEETTDSLTYVMETSHSVNASAHTAMSKTCQDLRGSDTDKYTGGNNTLLAPSSCERRLHNTQCQSNSNRTKDDCLPELSSKWEESSLGKESSTFESNYKSTSDNYENHNRNKETGRHALMPLWDHCSNRESLGKSQNLPSERKKLKVEVEKKENIISKYCPSPCSENSAVNEADTACCTITPCLSTAPGKLSSKAEEQKLSTRINESSGGAENVDCIKTTRVPTKAVHCGDVNPLSHSAGISKASSVGFLRPELRGSDCDTFALHNSTDKDVKTCLVKTGVPLLSDNAANVSSKIHHLQSGQLTLVPPKNAFSPKYILKLPQDKRNSDLSILLRSEQITPCTSVTDSLTSTPCSSSSRSPCSHSDDVLWSPLKFEVRQKGSKGELRWNVHANWKTPVLCSPVSSETDILTTVDSTLYKEEIMRGAWKNKQNKNKLNYQKQTEEKWMSITTSSAQIPKKKICFTSMYSSSLVISADIKEEKKVLHQLCSGGDSLMTTSGQREASSKEAESTVTGWDTGGSPRILKDMSPTSEDMEQSQSSRDSSTYLCHSFGTFYCHALTTHCKESPALHSNSLTSYSESFTVLSTKSTFPSLNAETRLTWCCLTKSLPLPAEQKGNADSAYSSMHTHDKESSNECTLSKYDISIFKMKNVSKTVAYGLTNKNLTTLPSSFSQGQQMQELCSAAPGGAFKNTSEKKKKPTVCKKEKLATNKLKRSHKQKKIKIPPKWYGGRHIHGYTQLRFNRLNKRHWFPNRTLEVLKKGYSSQACKFNQYKKCHSPQSKVQENYLHQQKDSSCSTSDKPLCIRRKEGKNNSGIFSHIENLNHVTQNDKEDKKGISGQIREHTRINSSFQNITPLEVPMTADSFPSSVNTAMRQASNDVELCCLATQPLVLQRSVPGESQKNVQTDSMASSFWSCPFGLTDTIKGDQSNSTNSETTCPLSLHLEASQENVPNVELEIQSFGTLDSVIQASGRANDQTEENTCSSSKENPTHNSQAGCLHSLGSKGESRLESVSMGKLSHTEYTEQENSQKILRLHGAADKNGAHQQTETYGRPHETATFKKPSVTLRSPEFNNYSATPSKTYKKRGLEMMRKQIRVEYDDTSSDDEDRLVIEI
ncbi:zinc finger protein 831 [Numida meleagris]|uniref:zinc finger protein 831 n=1 Tax=Numida meleagris TaxID=8996 RepID=UPI000B3DFF9B|nr:zinc finger protein 831 [Numida meleagris]XP_021272523.1 zinc finger protein 831 [Numida meleagris]XP_021272524.1 zinc finger protein 831 [Numida meleagris]XP_021272525.1 zinc finger protein 831 [Numida meleagris]XP_021272526.1 zinc finger protein 831 [Numida meleagris]